MKSVKQQVQNNKTNSMQQGFTGSKKRLPSSYHVNSRAEATVQRKLQEMANHSTAALQKQGVEEEELMQGKFATLQRVEEEEMLQGRFEPVQQQRNDTGLPDNLKSGMEQLSGRSLDHVKVHYNSAKPAAVQAHAFAQGNEIHLASGQQRHLPHELGHVVQQMEGRVQPTTTVEGVSVNDNPGLENEATLMGERALQIKQDNNI